MEFGVSVCDILTRGMLEDKENRCKYINPKHSFTFSFENQQSLGLSRVWNSNGSSSVALIIRVPYITRYSGSCYVPFFCD